MHMRLMKLLPIGALSIAALLVAGPASAQTQSTGAIQGSVTDEASGQPMLLVTVVASSASLQGQQSEFTDQSGQFFMSNLPPGSYSLLFVYGDAKVKRDNVEVSLGKVTVANAKINTQTAETIVVKERAPTIDAGSSKQGATIEKDYLRNVPNRGRTWGGVLSAAGGSSADLYGTSFSGSTSIENNYVVDGLNTTGITLGQGFPTQGSQVLNNFIQEIEVITGGYNAEFGRSTGGVVNVVTKTGSNDFHGSVFGNVTALNATRDAIPVAGNALRGQADSPTNVDFGFDLGGPIIKDKVWFYVGFAPVLTTQNFQRIVSTAVDRKHNLASTSNCARTNFDGTCDTDGNTNTTSAVGCERISPPAQGSCEGDGVPDIDPATGLPAFEQIDSSNVSTHNYTYQFMGKLNFAVTPEHQGQVTFSGQPDTQTILTLQFPDGTLNGTGRNQTDLNTDLGVKWTSKFNDNKTQVDFIGGWHRYSQDRTPFTDQLQNSPGVSPGRTPQLELVGDLATLSKGGVNHDASESALAMAACGDNVDRFASDPFPNITNCPDPNGYFLNGIGALNNTVEQRLSGKLTLTQRVTAAGHHQFKVGADLEGNYLDSNRGFSGNSVLTNAGTNWRSIRFVKLGAGSDVCGFQDGAPVPCTYADGLSLNAQTMNWGAFAQDSWSILPNLTINAGLRYEQQRLSYPNTLQSEVDPLTFNAHTDPMGTTGSPLGTYAMTLNDLVAPRVGIIYDWTKEGRSKIYANYGRFYESIPMDINNREFGGETQLQTNYAYASGGACGAAPMGDNDPRLPSDPYACPAQPTTANGARTRLIGASPIGLFDAPAGVNAVVAPGIGAQYLDEFVAGVEYEVLEDLRVGVAYQNRRLGNVIEDMSTDGASDYFVGNPGTFDNGEESKLLNQIHQLQAADPMDPRIAGLINRVSSFTATRRFDSPVRTYNALQVTASKRFSRNFMVQGSYTYSKLEGNYPGLFSPDTTQLDPNITSQYDLYELLGNRKGALPADVPHNFKLDGYYTFDLKEAGAITLGARLRGQSGLPYTPLAQHILYGQLESYLNPRGSAGRSAFQFNADMHVAYTRKIGPTELSLFFELFNVFNNQEANLVDQEYTIDGADPVIGGSSKDLAYVKPVWAPGSGMADNLGQASGSFTNGPNGVVTDPVMQAKLPIVKKLNFGAPTARVAPLAGRFGASLTF